jgi:hypothetical protein
VKKIASFLIMLGLGVVPAFAATSYHNVSLIDVGCSKKAAANPDAHTRSCAIMCAKSGYGILTSDNHFLKFDANGNQEVLKELKASHETDHLRVNVKGDVQGDTLKVSSVKLM